MPADLEALEALLAKATPGKWKPPYRMKSKFGGVLRDEDANCIAALHNAAPALIAEMRALREEVDHVIERFGDAEEEQTLMEVVEAVFLNGDQGWKMAGELQEANRWRPIADAPKDGTPVDLYSKRMRVPDCYWSVALKQWFSSDGRVSKPTHFMFRPDPPEGA